MIDVKIIDENTIKRSQILEINDKYRIAYVYKFNLKFFMSQKKHLNVKIYNNYAYVSNGFTCFKNKPNNSDYDIVIIPKGAEYIENEDLIMSNKIIKIWKSPLRVLTPIVNLLTMNG